MQEWDDLRVFLATARAGSARAGARALGVNQSTISRRISQLEERSGVLLFDRRPGGFALTEAGVELVELAAEVEARVAEVDRRLKGRDRTLSGQVRMSLPDFMVQVCAPHLARFGEAYPEIDLEVIVDNGLVRLTHREADLAVRLATGPPVQLVGRRVSPVGVAVYGSRKRYEPGCDVDLAACDWIRWDESWRRIPLEQWIDAHIPPERTRARINTTLAHRALIAEGLGVGFQPCYSGDADPDLVRLGPTLDLGLVLWLLTHDDLKRTARVRALLRFLGDALTAERARFEGEGP